MVDFGQNQLLLRQAINMGVTYWDTSEMYMQGGSEEGIGQYFEKYPEDRKKVFLVNKTFHKIWKNDPDSLLTKALEGSLQRLKTSHVNLFHIHSLENYEEELTPDVKKWADKAKADGKIRFFGFTAHMNVEECLVGSMAS